MRVGQICFNSEIETVCSVDSNQKVNQEFYISGIKYYLNPKHKNDLSSPGTAVKFQIQDPPQCNIDLDKIKQLQAQDPHLSKVIAKCTPHNHHNKTPYYLDEGVHGKVRNGSNIFHDILVPYKL